MGKIRLTRLLLLFAVLMAVILFGPTFVEFVFVFVVSTLATAAMFYFILFSCFVLDKILDRFSNN